MEPHKALGHGGDVYRNPVSHDFSINLNPLGMPEKVKDFLRDSVDGWGRYPDPECEALRNALAEYHHVPAEWILCANGAADLIFQVVRILAPKKALLLTPSFSEYRQALTAVGCEIETLPMKQEQQFQPDIEAVLKQITPQTDLLFFCNPNNPTGHAVSVSIVKKLADRCRQTKTWLLLDECFCELMEQPENFCMLPVVSDYENLVILRAFTKTYAMAGLRLGYAVSSSSALLQKIRQERQPWSVSVPAQEAGVAALKEQAYLKQARTLIGTERTWLICQLQKLGFTVFESDSNFILFYRKEKDPGELFQACLRRKILLRDCSNFDGLTSGYYRICVGIPEENRFLIRNLRELMDEKESCRNTGT